jgi:hypothetical protein
MAPNTFAPRPEDDAGDRPTAKTIEQALQRAGTTAARGQGHFHLLAPSLCRCHSITHLQAPCQRDSNALQQTG